MARPSRQGLRQGDPPNAVPSPLTIACYRGAMSVKRRRRAMIFALLAPVQLWRDLRRLWVLID